MHPTSFLLWPFILSRVKSSLLACLCLTRYATIVWQEHVMWRNQIMVVKDYPLLHSYLWDELIPLAADYGGNNKKKKEKKHRDNYLYQNSLITGNLISRYVLKFTPRNATILPYEKTTSNTANKAQLPVGLLVQLVERCTGIAEVMGSNPVQAWIFFRPYFHYCLSSAYHCEDHFHSHYSFSWLMMQRCSLVPVSQRIWTPLELDPPVQIR